MSKTAIKTLAAFLSGANQAKHSIGLQVGGRMGADAKEFFALRDALRVQGYASVEEAEQQIRATLKCRTKP